MKKILIDNTFFDITPEIIAQLFSELDQSKQARFFNEIARIATTYSLPMQLQYITEEDGLTLAGRRVMQEIGNYSHWGLSCKIFEEVKRNETPN